MDSDNFRANLAQYTGTTHYYRHGLNRSVTFTDGVKYFAETAGAFWLLDVLATELPELVLDHGIIFVTATSKDGQADLVAVRDKGQPPLWKRHIDYTNLPEGDWEFWFSDGGPDGTLVVFLSSEY